MNRYMRVLPPLEGVLKFNVDGLAGESQGLGVLVVSFGIVMGQLC